MVGAEKCSAGRIQKLQFSFGYISSFAEELPTAKGLMKYFSDYKTALLVCFMLDVHECLGLLSKQMHKQNVGFREIQPLIDGTIGQLEYFKSHDGNCLTGMKQHIEIKETEGEKGAYLMMRNF